MHVCTCVFWIYVAAAAKLLQSYPTLHDPIDGSPPGSAVPGIPQDEEAAHYIRNGLIEKEGSQYKLRFPYFTHAAFREFVSKFEAGGTGLEVPLGEWIKDIRETFASFVPERLDAQINQWVSHYANQLTGYVCEELIRRGVLKKPDEDAPLTEGVFYAEGKYIRDI